MPAPLTEGSLIPKFQPQQKRSFMDRIRDIVAGLSSEMRLEDQEQAEMKAAGIGRNPTTGELAAAATMPMLAVGMGAAPLLTAAQAVGGAAVSDLAGFGGRAAGEAFVPGGGEVGQQAGSLLIGPLAQKFGTRLGNKYGGLPASMAAKPAAAAAGETVTLYSGGPSGTFWSTDPARAAAYGPVRQVTVPKTVFEAGQKTAAQLGQPTKWDTVLPPDWAKRAVEAPHIKPTVHEAEELGGSEIDALLASLGVKKF